MDTERWATGGGAGGIFLILAGLLWAVLGAGVFLMAKSAIHEILGCLAVSFAVMFWGISGIIAQLRKMTPVQQPAASASPASIEQAIHSVRATAER